MAEKEFLAVRRQAGKGTRMRFLSDYSRWDAVCWNSFSSTDLGSCKCHMHNKCLAGFNFDCFALIQAQAVYWSWLQLIFRRYRGNRIDSMAEVWEAIQCIAPLKATESITLDPCGSQGWLDENRYSSLVCCRQTSQLHKQAIIVINWFRFSHHTSNTAFAIDFSVSTSFESLFWCVRMCITTHMSSAHRRTAALNKLQ